MQPPNMATKPHGRGTASVARTETVSATAAAQLTEASHKFPPATSRPGIPVSECRGSRGA
jgi:hypothetical protein